MAGNRIPVTANGGTPITTSYNNANQISNAGFTYDNAGNLLNDGTAAYTYDALSRTTARGGTTYAYNGDGTLVKQIASGTTTLYTQDLAAPLSQVLQTQVGAATRTDYLYGLNRLASLNGSTKTWYAADALGSVRRTVADSGTPLGIVNYDPWGTIETGTVTTFGFTGEVQDVASGLVNLRARWYSSTRGRFTSVDPFAGVSETPYSQHPYAYGMSDPVLMTDPSGKCLGYLWGDPSCQFAGTDYTKYDYAGTAQVAVTGAAVAVTVAGCAVTVLIGCAAIGGGTTAIASVVNQKLDNPNQPVNWVAVGRDAGIAAASAGVGGLAGKGVGIICKTGPWCATAVGAAIGSVSSGANRILGNLTDGDPNTAATDGVLGACVFGGLIGGIVGRLTIRLPARPGVWEPVNESMSPRAAAYQQQITGRTGQVYRVNGVKFDGYQNGTLIDAKGPGYATFVRNGRFQAWFRGQNSLVEQAERQILAANGTPIQWHVAEQEAATAIRALLQVNGYDAIQVIHTP